MITTIAGNGSIGFSGDGGPAISAMLNPDGVAADQAGNIFITDESNFRVRNVLLASPAVNSGGVVPAAGFQPGPVAVSSIISLFGRNLAPYDNLATTQPLPARLGGLRLLIGNQEAPLFFAGPTQVNAQVPFGVPAE